MGDYHGIIPIPDKFKAGADVVVVPPMVVAWFDWVTLPHLATLAGLIYTLLRIAELLYGWWKKRG